jgi:predicted nucleotidyltransferase
MLSVSRERPVDPTTIEILEYIDRSAKDLGLEYFVMGATARDILLNGVFGLGIELATLDVDFAVAVRGWPQFDALKTWLVQTTKFTPDAREIHRLFYLGQTGQRGYPLDLIPFGGIEEPPNAIAWPPDRDIVMNVTGFLDAFAAAHAVEIHPGFIVRVVSLPGLAILKLFAWADRGADNSKDATDLATLLCHYDAAGNDNRLYGEEIGILEASGYNIDLAGPRLLGKDASRIAAPTTRAKMFGLLNDAGRLEQLTRDVAKAVRAVADDPVAVASELIAQFKAGLNDS